MTALEMAQLDLRGTELVVLLNEAIVIALEHMRSGRLAAADRIDGYVFRITMNLLRNHQRNMNNRADLRTTTEFLQSAGRSSEIALGQQRIKQLVRRVIDSLGTVRDREIVRRYCLDEEQKANICAALGVTALHFDKLNLPGTPALEGVVGVEGIQSR